MTRRSFARPITVVATLLLAAPLAACTSKAPDELSQDSAQVQQGQHLFARNCAMCHTLTNVGSEGSATEIHERERVDGPNFDERKESREAILYAIRNGGFSGAIMPENIVVGAEAEAVAAYLEKYAGRASDSEGQERQSNPGQDGQLSGRAGGNG